MDALKVLRERRSVRQYLNKPVDKKLLEKLIEYGSLAATAKNIQPWKFVIVSDEEDRYALKDMIPNGPHIGEAPALIVVFCRETKYFLEDGCAATQNILLAAKALGLGACWIAGNRKDYTKPVKEFLNVPDNYQLISLISVGYPEKESSPVKKKLQDVICWNKFN